MLQVISRPPCSATLLTCIAGLCTSLATGCIYVPIRDISEPALESGTGAVRKVPFDVRKACSPDSPIHAGVLRSDVHRLLGLPAEANAASRPVKVQKEQFEFSTMTEYFYLFGVIPIGTHSYLTKYVLIIRYGGNDRVSGCEVSKVAR